jgi:hypothetical protein
VGHDEEALPAVGRADVRCLDERRLNPVASAFKVGPDSSEVSIPNESAHVFDEDPGRLALSDDAEGVGPEVSGVFDSGSLAGDTPRLTRDAASDAIHRSTPRSAVEGSEISPKRRRVKASVFHPLSQDEGSRCFVFHPTDDASSWLRHSDAEVESAGSGAEAKHVEGTRTHIHNTLHVGA